MWVPASRRGPAPRAKGRPERSSEQGGGEAATSCRDGRIGVAEDVEEAEQVSADLVALVARSAAHELDEQVERVLGTAREDEHVGGLARRSDVVRVRDRRLDGSLGVDRRGALEQVDQADAGLRVDVGRLAVQEALVGGGGRVEVAAL